MATGPLSHVPNRNPHPKVATDSLSHVPSDEELGKIMADEARVSHVPHSPVMPDAWIDPATGVHMWREERYEFLRKSEA